MKSAPDESPVVELWARAQRAWDAGRQPSEDEAFLEYLGAFPELAADSTDLANILRLETRVDQLERTAPASPRGWPLYAAACAAVLVALLALIEPQAPRSTSERPDLTTPVVATHEPQPVIQQPTHEQVARRPTLVGFLEITTSHEAFGQRTPRTIRSHTSRRTLRSPLPVERP